MSKKTLVIRKNAQVYALFTAIQNRQPSLKTRNQVVEAALERAVEDRQKGLVWTSIKPTKIPPTNIEEADLPETIQINVNQDDYLAVAAQIKSDFDLDKDSPGSYVVKMLLTNYLNFLKSLNPTIGNEDKAIKKTKMLDFANLSIDEKLNAVYGLLLDIYNNR